MLSADCRSPSTRAASAGWPSSRFAKWTSRTYPGVSLGRAFLRVGREWFQEAVISVVGRLRVGDGEVERGKWSRRETKAGDSVKGW